MAGARVRTGDHDLRAFVGRVRGEREELQGLLDELGAQARSSQANFVFARFRDAGWVRDALAGLGIAVRIFPGREDLREALRITCPGTEEGFGRLEGALRAALAPDALLFDMDGVLVDVSGSYRQAIIDTAASFGVAVTTADIADEKAKGDANNDWIVTRRLLAARGVDAPLDEVTARFEAAYQGTEEEPGLRATERLLPDRALLERLARRVKLGVVTGRPRSDAARALAEHGIGHLFGSVVCMEDATRKPDPAPVRRALAQLSARSAWLVGDTPDDIRASRAAHVVPIGIPAPGEDPEAAARVLALSGAGRVIRSLSELEELLP
jgi:HAD superfamily hydrolase (TIGR01548 family)